MLQASNEQAERKAREQQSLAREKDELEAKVSVLETACAFWRKERLQRPPAAPQPKRHANSSNAERQRSIRRHQTPNSLDSEPSWRCYRMEQLFAERERLADLCATLDPVAFREEAAATMTQLANLERELAAEVATY